MSDTEQQWPRTAKGSHLAWAKRVGDLWELRIVDRSGEEVGVTQVERLEDAKRVVVDYLDGVGVEVTEGDVFVAW